LPTLAWKASMSFERASTAGTSIMTSWICCRGPAISRAMGARGSVGGGGGT
jgi:hypothetical protein